MNEEHWTKQAIETHADNLRKRIKTGYLYGHPVDMKDVNSLIVAAYLLGQTEERQERQRTENPWIVAGKPLVDA